MLLSLLPSSSSPSHPSSIPRTSPQPPQRLHHHPHPHPHPLHLPLDPLQLYGAIIIIAMLKFAQPGDARNLTDPLSYTHLAITLHITGNDPSSQFSRQCGIYTLYHALPAIPQSNISTASEFVTNGNVGCRVTIAPPSTE
ncbi:MAG: hypothetical protein Q9184_005077 [Pyrenodesmia sp. 2 TL-2023]